MLRIGEACCIVGPQVLLEVRAGVNNVVGFGELRRAQVNDAAAPGVG
jgi:hypothetical protein